MQTYELLAQAEREHILSQRHKSSRTLYRTRGLSSYLLSLTGHARLLHTRDDSKPHPQHNVSPVCGRDVTEEPGPCSVYRLWICMTGELQFLRWLQCSGFTHSESSADRSDCLGLCMFVYRYTCLHCACNCRCICGYVPLCLLNVKKMIVILFCSLMRSACKVHRCKDVNHNWKAQTKV